MAKKKMISGKGHLRAFVEQVNSNHLARLQFLLDPVHALDEAGIKLDDESRSELEALVHEFLQKFPNAALLPAKPEGVRGEDGDDDDSEEGVYMV